MIFKVLLACLLVLSTTSLGFTATTLKNNTIYSQTKKKLITDIEIIAVKYSDIKMVAIDSESATTDLPVGLYFFDHQGKQISYLKFEEAEYVGDAFLSPTKKYIAIDLGTSVIRTMTFYTYPDFKEIKSLEYLEDNEPSLVWYNNTAIFNNQTFDEKRKCDYDPCGPTFVDAFDADTSILTTIVPSTPLCNVLLQGIKGKVVRAKMYCVKNQEAWSTYADDREKMTPTIKTYEFK